MNTVYLKFVDLQSTHRKKTSYPYHFAIQYVQNHVHGASNESKIAVGHLVNTILDTCVGNENRSDAMKKLAERYISIISLNQLKAEATRASGSARVRLQMKMIKKGLYKSKPVRKPDVTLFDENYPERLICSDGLPFNWDEVTDETEWQYFRYKAELALDEKATILEKDFLISSVKKIHSYGQTPSIALRPYLADEKRYLRFYAGKDLVIFTDSKDSKKYIHVDLKRDRVITLDNCNIDYHRVFNNQIC